MCEKEAELVQMKNDPSYRWSIFIHNYFLSFLTHCDRRQTFALVGIVYVKQFIINEQ